MRLGDSGETGVCEFGCEELRSEAAILGQIAREAVRIFGRSELAVGFLA